jgi:hypothetical protein
MGTLSMTELYQTQKGQTKKRDLVATNYNHYRGEIDKYDPAYQPKGRLADIQARLPPVAQEEWDNYLSPGTTFDTQVEAAIAAGWTITLVRRKSDSTALKRIEAKREPGAPSIILWSAAGSVNEGILDQGS